MIHLTVVYESGILKPTEPLDLPEGQRLQIQILEIAPALNPLEQALQPLIRSGALTSSILNRLTPLPEVSLFSRPESEFETHHINSPNLLSESIIEDRGLL